MQFYKAAKMRAPMTMLVESLWTEEIADWSDYIWLCLMLQGSLWSEKNA